MDYQGIISQDTANVVYLIAAVLFIIGLKGLAHPRTAVRANQLSGLGMFLAVVAALLSPEFQLGWGFVVIGIAVGGVIGYVAALKVAMTSMPEMVGLFNGFGGAASVLVAGAAMISILYKPDQMPGMQMSIATVLSGLVGSVTWFGSYIAFAKLSEFIAVKWKLKPWQKIVKAAFALLFIAVGIYVVISNEYKPLSWVAAVFFAVTAGLTYLKKPFFPGLGTVKIVLAIATIVAGVLMVLQVTGTARILDWTTETELVEQSMILYWLVVAVSGVLGILLTISIGGADMPVVIALLNSYSGIAGAMTGFVINNSVLVISGSLVGASGIILVQIMCKAMNRSLANVYFGGVGLTVQEVNVDEVYKNVKSTSAEEIAMVLESSQKVLIVPGYGMAVSQAQHTVRDLANLLESKFHCEVIYGVHPVAGRMPGHMNVLLAEANVPYDKLLEMDMVNSMMDSIDVAIVVGANDVVNPVARTDPKSPIAGMPIIDVDKAHTVIVIKRSLSPGFAGIPNPLFALDNALMFFNDGKKAFNEIIAAVKEV